MRACSIEGCGKPPVEPSGFAGWPLLAIAGVIGLCAYAYIYRRQDGEP